MCIIMVPLFMFIHVSVISSLCKFLLHTKIQYKCNIHTDSPKFQTRACGIEAQFSLTLLHCYVQPELAMLCYLSGLRIQDQPLQYQHFQGPCPPDLFRLLPWRWRLMQPDQNYIIQCKKLYIHFVGSKRLKNRTAEAQIHINLDIINKNPRISSLNTYEI